MNTSHILLSSADRSRLESLIRGNLPPPYPDPDQKRRLELFLSTVHGGNPAMLSTDHAGLHDRITLGSPLDPRDTYTFSIVMPREADVDAGRISVHTPLCLAVLGRARGSDVAWETSLGQREMKILSIEKAARVDDLSSISTAGDLSLEIHLAGASAG